MLERDECALDPEQRVVVGEVDGLEVLEQQRAPEQTLVEGQREAAVDVLAVHQRLRAHASITRWCISDSDRAGQ